MIEIATDAVIGLAFAGFPAPVVPAWSRRKGLQRGPLGEVLVDLLANQLKSEGVTTVQRPQFSGNHIQRSMDLWERLRRHFAPES
jgi:hypothetical protein